MTLLKTVLRTRPHSFRATGSSITFQARGRNVCLRGVVGSVFVKEKHQPHVRKVFESVESMMGVVPEADIEMRQGTWTHCYSTRTVLGVSWGLNRTCLLAFMRVFALLLWLYRILRGG